MKKIILFLLIPFILKAQFIANTGAPSETILHIECRDYNGDQGCLSVYAGWTYYLWYSDFVFVRDSLVHCENDGYNDSAQSVVINNNQYQVNCACNDLNAINMFVRNCLTGAKTDSLIILSDQTGNYRLTLLGICKWQGTAYCLISGYEREAHPPGVPADDNYGIYRWTPGETTAYYLYDTGASGGYGMNGLAMNGKYVYTVSENTDTLEVIDTSNWTQSAVKDMNQAGGQFRGIAIIGSSIIVANATDKTLDYYNLSDLSYSSSLDIAEMIIEGNILYGLWTRDEFR